MVGLWSTKVTAAPDTPSMDTFCGLLGYNLGPACKCLRSHYLPSIKFLTHSLFLVIIVISYISLAIIPIAFAARAVNRVVDGTNGKPSAASTQQRNQPKIPAAPGTPSNWPM